MSALQNYIETAKKCGFDVYSDETVLAVETPTVFWIIGKEDEDDDRSYLLTRFIKPIDQSPLGSGDYQGSPTHIGSLAECCFVLSQQNHLI